MTAADGVRIDPVPTDDEAAAIVAALTVGLPSAAAVDVQPVVSRWRFSGRWWSRPVPQRRVRPSS